MKKVCVMLLAACLLLGSGCTPAPAEPATPTAEVSQPVETPALPPLLTDEEAFAALLDEVNAKNAALDAPTADLDRYRYDFSSGRPLFTEADAALMEDVDEVEEFPTVITRADAKAEVEWLFRLLRTRYGLYSFYGGDEVFDAVRGELLSQLDAGGDTLDIEREYIPLLCGKLDFVKDNHFLLGNGRGSLRSPLLGNPLVSFSRRGDDFYGGEQGERKVLSLSGKSPEEYLKPTIGMAGELTWCPYSRAVPGGNSSEMLTIVYEDGSEQRIALKETAAVPAGSTGSDEACITAVENGVYTAQLSRMMFHKRGIGPYTEGDDLLHAQVMDTARAMREYPVAVFDLRYNSGGNGLMAEQWLKVYTGDALQPNYCTLALRRELDGSQGSEEDDKGYINRGILPDGDYYVKLPTPQFIDPQGPLLVVRTGSMTASAAEGFTDMARNLKNTLVVGAPTGGALTGSMTWFRSVMPWSKQGIAYGEDLFYYDADYFAEGRGLEPDLYLTGGNTDERLALFLARYVTGQ